MAKIERILSIKIEGVKNVVTSLEEANAAIAALNKRQDELRKQLSETTDAKAYVRIAEEIKAVNAEIRGLEQFSAEAFGKLGGDAQAAASDVDGLNARLDETDAKLNSLGEDADGFDTTAENISLLKQQLRDIETFSGEAFSEVRSQIDPTDRSLDGLKNRVELLEDALGGVEVGSEQFRILSTELNRTEKQIEAARLEGEALALGFDALDASRSTAEGLSVQITALEAAFSSANDEAERAAISQEIARLEFALEDVQAAAKQGIFPPGSLGALNAELEQLEGQIRRVPAGSAEFDRIKARLEEVQTQTEVLNLSVQDQARLYEDLGVSIISSLGQLGGILQSIGADSEEAQQALLALEQATAAVGLIQQAVELKRQAQKAATLAAIQAETAATEANTKATRENAQATTGAGAASGDLAGGLDATSKAGKGFRGVLKGIGAAIKANPILFLASALIGIGAAVGQLAKKFKPLSDALDVIDDALGGISGAFKAAVGAGDQIIGLFQNIGQAYLDYLAVPLQAIKGAFLFIAGQDDPFAGLEAAANDLQGSLNDVADSAGKLGDAIADGYERGARRAARLRDLERREQLQQVSDLAAEREEAELGSAEATAAARRAIRVRELAEDRELQLQRLKLEQELTDQEIAIIRSGNEEKIKDISKLVNARGEVNEKVLEQVKALQQTEIEIAREREAAFQESIDRRLAGIDRQLQIEEARLGLVDNLANREKAIVARRDAEIKALETENRAGRIATEQEFNDRLQLIQLNAAGELNEIERTRLQNETDLRQIAREGQLAELDNELEIRRAQGNLTLEQEKELIDRRIDLQRQGIQEELALLDLSTEEGVAEQARLTNELNELQREQSRQTTDAIIRDAERRKQAQLRAIDLQIQAREAFAPIEELRDRDLQRQIDLQRERADEERAAAITARQEYAAVQEQIDAVNAATELRIANLEVEARKQQEALDAEQERLEALQSSLQEDLAAGRGNATELADELESVNKELEKVANQKIVIDAELPDKKADAEKAGKEQAEALEQGFRDGLLEQRDAFGEGIALLYKEAFGEAENFLEGDEQLAAVLVAQTADALNQIRTLVAESRISALDDELQAKEAEIEGITENISALEEQAQSSAETLEELQGQLELATGARSASLQVQITEETERRNELNQSIRDNENARAAEVRNQERLEAEKERLQRRQFVIDKAFDLASAISNTALAVTNALGAFPPPLSFIAAAAAGAAGAAQIATISATQFTAEDGGELALDEAGRPLLLRRGGEVEGPSHAQGGVRGTGRFNNIEVEGGEFIVNKEATKKFKPVLESINSFADGGELPIFQRSRKYAAGGSLEPSAALMDALSRRSDNARSADELSALREELPNLDLKVSVVDINDAQERVKMQDEAGEI